MTVNFFCEYPCASCDDVQKDKCHSCYSTAKEFLWHDYACFQECPLGFTNTTTNNCTACTEPCATCSDTPETCTSCISGFTLYWDRPACRELVYWPFPFLCLGFVFFTIISISECTTKGESRFKEALIALVSLPEVAAWACFLVFLYSRTNLVGSFYLGSLAAVMYITINFVHAIV